MPMILHVENKSVEDMMNNWLTGGQTRHYHSQHELKEQNVLRTCIHARTHSMETILATLYMSASPMSLIVQQFGATGDMRVGAMACEAAAQKFHRFDQ